MEKTKYDFTGWATVAGVKCSDGRIIHKDAFKENDGTTVPFIWNHDHDKADNVAGHAYLENKEKGIYAYVSLNDTAIGKNVKELIKHGDITNLSIYANKLIQKDSEVISGVIREVSAVLAGANPGAFIDNVLIHGELNQDEAVIYNEEEIDKIILHNEEFTPIEKKEVNDKNIEDIQHKEENKETLADIFNTLTEKQKTLVYIMIDEVLDQSQENIQKEDKKLMQNNVFEDKKPGTQDPTQELTHSDMMAVIATAKKSTHSLKEVLTSACLEHGITNLSVLFPEPKLTTPTLKTLDENNDWVDVVMNGVKHTPFSRVRSGFFDITGEEARALGYVKGNKKEEEVIVAVKRSTDPQTVYKLQKFDRDDLVDISDFDVVSWIKVEMRGKLNKELARAFLFGDGRKASDTGKIDPLHIRPVVGDDEVYTIPVEVAGVTAAEVAEQLVDKLVEGQLAYKGTGNLTAFIRDDILTKCLLLKDSMKHRLFTSIEILATAMNVKKIVKVPASIMGSTYAVALDLSDYNIGADKGGAVSLFDDFDINYNKYE